MTYPRNKDFLTATTELGTTFPNLPTLYLSRPNKIYFIYAPEWTHTSSGVKALYLLCAYLNEWGNKAYIASMDRPCINPLINAPLLPEEVWSFYLKYPEDVTVIYPDIVKGNPLNAKRIIRWLLAPAGEFGGETDFGNDQVYGYTKEINENVLYIPTFNFNKFYNDGRKKTGSCYYAHKYDKIHQNELLDITSNSIRLEGSEDEIAEILKNSEVCYIYERTELAVHAVACGCKVIMIRTPYFNKQPEFFSFKQMTWHDTGEQLSDREFDINVLKTPVINID